MAECKAKLQWLGQAAPRTCPVCRLGPCNAGPGGTPWMPLVTAMGGPGPAPEAIPGIPGIQVTTESNHADAAAHYLWGILDDIETTEDLAGDGPRGDRAFRAMVLALISKRWNVATIPEGRDTIEWKAPPPEDGPKPS